MNLSRKRSRRNVQQRREKVVERNPMIVTGVKAEIDSLKERGNAEENEIVGTGAKEEASTSPGHVQSVGFISAISLLT